MAINEFLAFATAPSANVLPQDQYALDPVLAGGFTQGLLVSAKTNKVWRQASFVAAALGYFIQHTTNVDVRDDGNIGRYAGQFVAAIQAVSGGGGGGGGGIPEAPLDGVLYGRQDSFWIAALPLSGGTLTGPLHLAADPTDTLGAVTKGYTDNRLAGKAPLLSPIFTGLPAAPTASAGTNTTQLATTGFVMAAVAAATSGVSSIAAGTGIAVSGATGNVAVSLQVPVTIANGGTGSTNAAGGLASLGAAPLNSPSFTGAPAGPNPPTLDNTTRLATTAWVRSQNFIMGNQTIALAGDLRGSGETTITGTVVGLQGRAVSNVPPTDLQILQFSAANSAWQAVTLGAGGTITGVTAGNGLIGGGTTGAVTMSLDAPVSVANGGTGATTAGLALANLGGAPIASPTLSGTPTAPTPPTSNNSTNLATTAFVKNQNYAPLNSPDFTNLPTAPTPPTPDNSTRLATTAWVRAAAMTSLSVGTGLTTAGANPITATGTVMLQVPVSVANGGTGQTTLTNQALLIGAGVGQIVPSPIISSAGTYLQVSRNVSALPAPDLPNSLVLRLVAATGQNTNLLLDAYHTSGPVLTFSQARGTPAARTATRSTDIMGLIQFVGWTGSAWAYGCGINGQAYEDWTTGQQGSQLTFGTIQANTTQADYRMIIRNGVIVGNQGPDLGTGRLLVNSAMSPTLPGFVEAANLRVAGANGQNCNLLMDAFGTGATSSYVGRSAGGTVQTPLALRTNDLITNIQGQGFDGAGYRFGASIQFVAAENWNANAIGSRIVFYCNMPGTVTGVAAMALYHDALSVNGTGINYPYAYGGSVNRIAFGWGTITAGLVTISVDNGGFAGTLNVTASDARMKTGIAESSLDCLATVMAMPLHEFAWKEIDDPNKLAEATRATTSRSFTRVGLVAQEIAAVFPEAVMPGDDFEDKLGRVWQLDPSPLFGALMGAVQQLAKRVETLEGG